ncbi:hypothetical protein ACKI1Q_41590 [Streptomyces galilaeus]|uniref:hypothetical protein n=1 Tax=Streptomyces galilaeus TaxID=33899 RepID=UPI0038F7BA65
MNRFGLATVGVGGSHSSVRGHKLTLNLQVKDRATGGASPEIGRQQFGSWDDER